MRKSGDPPSTADAIAITHHAGMLARLRGRGHTTLDDIDDALITCCCKPPPRHHRNHGHAAERKKKPWHVLVVDDQSGSMLECTVFSAMMASIFAEMPAMKTSLILYDTRVVDLSDQLGQPDAEIIRG